MYTFNVFSISLMSLCVIDESEGCHSLWNVVCKIKKKLFCVLCPYYVFSGTTGTYI